MNNHFIFIWDFIPTTHSGEHRRRGQGNTDREVAAIVSRITKTSNGDAEKRCE